MSMKPRIEIGWIPVYKSLLKIMFLEGNRVMPSDCNYHPRFLQSEVDFVPRCCAKCTVN